MRIAFASLLMYYPNTLKEFGMNHVLTIALRNAAISSKIKTSQSSSPSSVLLIWAEVIETDFKDRNVKFKQTDTDVLPVLKNMCSIMNTMETKMQTMITQQQDYKEKIQTLQDQVESMSNKVELQNESQKTMKRKMSFLRTPPSAQQVKDEDADDEVIVVEHRPAKRRVVELDGEGAVPVSMRIEETCSSSSKRNVFSSSSKKGNSKCLHLTTIISDAHQAGVFAGGVFFRRYRYQQS